MKHLFGTQIKYIYKLLDYVIQFYVAVIMPSLVVSQMWPPFVPHTGSVSMLMMTTEGQPGPALGGKSFSYTSECWVLYDCFQI